MVIGVGPANVNPAGVQVTLTFAGTNSTQVGKIASFASQLQAILSSGGWNFFKAMQVATLFAGILGA